MKYSSILLATGICAGAFMGCSHAQTLDASTAVPAAEGKINTETTKNDNTKLKISVKHLAHADRVEPTASQYVVWMQPEGEDSARNLGTLAVNKDLEGSYETTIPYSHFRVFVTPEADRLASAPTGPVVLEKTLTK